MLTTHHAARLSVLVLLTSALALAAAIPWAPAARAGDATDDDATTERAQEALGPFKRALKQALTEGLREGPVQAIDACNTKAPGIAQAHSTSGVRVGRASHRLRKPAERRARMGAARPRRLRRRRRRARAAARRVG